MVVNVINKYLHFKSIQHFRATVYTVTLIHHTCCILHLAFHDFESQCSKSEIENIYASFYHGGRYLTLWNFLIQIIHAGLGLRCELAQINNSSSDLTNHFKFKERLFTSIMFPNSVFVCIIFWFLFLQDKTLLMHECINLPSTVNHGLHTWIIPVILIELFLRPRKRPESHLFNCGLLVGFMALYYIAVLHAHWESGTWVYPVIHRWKNSLYYIMASGMATSLFSYWLQWKLIDIIWHKK